MSNDTKTHYSASREQKNSGGGAAYLQLLHELIASYDVILLDTTTALYPGFEALLSDLILILRQYNKKLTVLPCVVDRLSKLADDTEAKGSPEAKRALEIIRILRNHDIAVVMGAHFWGGNPSKEIISNICEIAFSRSVLLLTQSSALATDCALLGWLRTCRLQNIAVRCIFNVQGQLSEFCNIETD